MRNVMMGCLVLTTVAFGQQTLQERVSLEGRNWNLKLLRCDLPAL